MGPEVQAGNRGDISWQAIAARLHALGYGQRLHLSVRNKWQALLKSYETVKFDEEKGTGEHVKKSHGHAMMGDACH